MRTLDIDTIEHIPLSNGGFALVDAADAERVQRHVWHRDTGGYARAMIKQNGRWRLVRMHRFLLDDDAPQVDHRDRNRLNNCRSNLRPCTAAQNMANIPKKAGCTSAFKGVSWHRPGRKWMAQIKVNGKRVYLGSYTSENEAAEAYRVAASASHGEFAVAS